MGVVRRLFRRSFDQVEAYAAAWELDNPNDTGYRQWADAVVEALSAEGGPLS